MNGRPTKLQRQLDRIWEEIASLSDGGSGGQGPKGDKGDTGDQGPAGATGPEGPPGPDGADGQTGPQGPKGDQGDTGPAGATGSQGNDGNDGAVGPQGPQGVAGPPGDAGPKGDTGNTGDTGPAGPQGVQGQAGADGAGADPWTVLRLANDFTTTSGTAVSVTGLAFAPAANKGYEFEAKVRLRTATATIGARPGLTWPTGLTDGGVGIWAPNSATAEAIARQPAGVAAVAASTGLPNTTQSWPGFISGEVQTGGSPSGNVQVTLNAETAGTTVTMKAGSFLRYREVA